MQVKDEGRVFNEVVKINAQRKTETFDVPSQQGFEAAQFIHDFRKVSRDDKFLIRLLWRFCLMENFKGKRVWNYERYHF